MNIDNWIDLSKYGLTLRLIKVPSGKDLLVLSGDGVEAHAKGAISLGLRKMAGDQLLYTCVVDLAPPPVDKAKNVPAGQAQPISKVMAFEAWRKHFEDAALVPFDADTHVVDRRGVVARPAGTGAAQSPKGVARNIGMNSLGHDVFEDEEGRRYSVDARKGVHSESDAAPGQAGNFLRAPDGAALALCAQGLVEQATRNRILRRETFEKFVDATLPAGKDRGEFVSEAIRATHAAAARHLARRGGKTLREGYILAQKLQENLAFLFDGHFATEASAMGPAPLVGVAVQRMLNLSSREAGGTLAFERAGGGFLMTHVPKGVSVVLGGAGAIDSAEAVARQAGVTQVSRGEPGKAEFVVFNGGGEAQDVAEAERLLDARPDAGASVMLFEATEGNKEALERFRVKLATRYAFDGEASIDGGLVYGRPGGPACVVMSVGARRPQPEPTALAPVPDSIHDGAHLWSWTNQVVQARAVSATSIVTGAALPEIAAGEGESNAYQAPYVSASRIGSPSTMMPRNLEAATRGALTRASAHAASLGFDLDGWVAKEFRYSREDLARIFSPEQVDALALYLFAEHRDRAFLNADQTGVGKGRTLAAIMRRNAILGYRTIFQTERQQNLSDIWRDIVHTESQDHFRPLLLNENGRIIDERTGKTLLGAAPREQVDAMLAERAWPDDVNLLLATYSQFNREAGKDASLGERDRGTAKSDWLAGAVDDNTRIVLDECHNAASMESNISTNIARAVEASQQVTYSSATYSKDANNMAFYRPLLPKDVSAVDLASMMKKGGETFQEVLSGMLAHDGVMIRREFDLSRVTYETIVDTPRFERNRNYMDAIAPILFELVRFSGDVDEKIKAANEARANARRGRGNAEEGEAGRRRAKPLQMSRIGFGAPLYTISRLFVAALKVDAVVEDALKALSENKKPVVVVENTIQTLLEEIAENEADAEGAIVPDFKALFHRTLRQMRTARWRDANQDLHVRDMAQDDAALQAKVDRLVAMIDALPLIPVSAIDEVKRRIAEAGWTCDEITGRTLEVRDGRIMRRPASNPTVTKNAFNSGEVDAIVINVAGSTGIDLHASSRFVDKRKRRMIELQASADILRKVQTHGRVNRYDQVEDPEIASILSGLPIELRLCAMENAKLRKLSANTTSNRDAANLMRHIPDLINPVGDIVCARYAEVRPELMQRLGFKVADIQKAAEDNRAADELADEGFKAVMLGTKALEEADGAAAVPAVRRERQKSIDEAFRVKDSKRSANEILARLIMLPVSQQEKICNELTAEFLSAVEELEAKGETPLKTDDLRGIVHERERRIFDGAEVDNPDSVFQEPLYEIEGALERTGTPIRMDDLMERIQIGEMASGRAQNCIDILRAHIDQILEPFLPTGCPTVEEAIAREVRGGGNTPISNRKKAIERLADTLANLRPGKQVTYSGDGVATTGVVTRVVYPDRGYEASPHSYRVEFVVPGDEKIRTLRLQTLANDPLFAVKEGLEGEAYDKIRERFENAERIKMTPITILTHNIYRAMRMNVAHRLGKLMMFKTKDGGIHRGVVLSRGRADLKAVPVELKNADMAWAAAIDDRAELVGSAAGEAKNFTVTHDFGDTFTLRLPRNGARFGYLYDDALLSALLERAGPFKGSSVTIKVQREEAFQAVKNVYALGGAFTVSSVHRKWAEAWLKDASSEKEPTMGMVA